MLAVASYAQAWLAALLASVATSSALPELFRVGVEDCPCRRAVAPMLRGGRFRIFLDNPGCVFIMGGFVPESAIYSACSCSL
jgi:hypothetical protein